MLLRGAAVESCTIADVRISAGRITEIGNDLRARSGEEVVELDERVLLPGLVDHHIHLLSVAASAGSVDCGPPAVRSHADLVAAIGSARQSTPTGWLRGTGCDLDLLGAVDRAVLDRAGGGPVRVQDRTGSTWVLNSAALAVVVPPDPADWPAGLHTDAAGVPTGRLTRLDHWLRSRVPAAVPDLTWVGVELARRGVTSVMDATATNDASTLALLAEAPLPQRVSVMNMSATAPVKIMLDDVDLPSLEELAAHVAGAHAQQRRVAVHCVTPVQLVLALAAGLGRGDRIEHASVVHDDALPLLARAQVTVVSQPALVWSRGDRYLADVDPGDRRSLYRLGALRAAGIAIAAGSDAPFGPLDPWRAIDAAMQRRTSAGASIGADEALGLRHAIDLYLGPVDNPGQPRRIGPGVEADLCIVDGTWADLASDPASASIATTMIAGDVVSGVLPQRPGR